MTLTVAARGLRRARNGVWMNSVAFLIRIPSPAYAKMLAVVHDWKYDKEYADRPYISKRVDVRWDAYPTAVDNFVSKFKTLPGAIFSADHINFNLHGYGLGIPMASFSYYETTTEGTEGWTTEMFSAEMIDILPNDRWIVTDIRGISFAAVCSD